MSDTGFTRGGPGLLEGGVGREPDTGGGGADVGGYNTLVQREAAQGQAPHASEIEDAFISQLPQAHHLSDRGSQAWAVAARRRA